MESQKAKGKRQKLTDRGARSVQGASWILIVTLLFSNVLGLIRDHYLAQKIPTDLLDVYFAGFRLPDLLFNIIILGGISAVFIPTFLGKLASGERLRAWRLANSFINLGLIVLSVLIGLLLAFYPALVPYLVGDFPAEKQMLTVVVGRLLLIPPLLFAVSYIMSGILNSFKHFVAYSVAPLLYNLSIIIFTVFLGDEFQVFAPVYGVILGAGLHLLVQLFAALRVGYRYEPVLDLKDGELIEMMRLMAPRSLALGLSQLLLIVYTALAASLGAGSVSIFNFASNIYTMPIVVFGTSFATAVFPTLAEQIGLRQSLEFTRSFERAFRAIIFLLVPATVGVILLRAQIVRLALGSGHFGWEETVLTLETLAWLAVSLLPAGLVPLISRGFYALKDTLTPTYSTIIQVGLGVFLAYALTPLFGIKGLALALSASIIIQLIVLYLWLRRRLVELEPGFFFWPLVRSIVSALIMGLVVWLVLQVLAEGLRFRWIELPALIDTSTGLGLLIQLAVSIPVGLLVYLVVSRGLGSDELDWLIEARLGGRLGQLAAVLRLVVPYIRKNGNGRR